MNPAFDFFGFPQVEDELFLGFGGLGILFFLLTH